MCQRRRITKLSGLVGWQGPLELAEPRVVLAVVTAPLEMAESTEAAPLKMAEPEGGLPMAHCHSEPKHSLMVKCP